MKLIEITLMLSFWGLDAVSEDLIPEQNVFMKEISWKQSNDTSQKFNSDVILTTPEIITRAGYPVETHIVTTEDGYILTLHRIPGGKDSLPVLLQHALISSSADWLILGEGKAIAYSLADQGYDVWLGNSRGNLYSRAHISLSPSNTTFWNYSFHEIGIYDLPAIITFITNMRSQPLHTYIGHSMGTTCFYIMAAERPEIARMVQKMISFGPTAFVGHMKSSLQYIIPFSDQLQMLMGHFFYGEFLNDDWNKRINNFFMYNSMTQELCVKILFTLFGYDYEQFNYTLLPFILDHDPAGSSAKSWLHYGQLQESGKFRQFDYGSAKNLLIYQSEEPPEYNLANITVPIALMYGINDWLAVPIDVKRLFHSLPNVIDMYEVPWPKFNHGDFIWANDAPKLLYERVFQIMREEIPNNVISIEE